MTATSEPPARSYGDAMAELDDILAELESGKVDVDTLCEQVARGALLIRWCRQRLDSVREDVDSVVSEMHADS